MTNCLIQHNYRVFLTKMQLRQAWLFFYGTKWCLYIRTRSISLLISKIWNRTACQSIKYIISNWTAKIWETYTVQTKYWHFISSPFPMGKVTSMAYKSIQMKIMAVALKQLLLCMISIAITLETANQCIFNSNLHLPYPCLPRFLARLPCITT